MKNEEDDRQVDKAAWVRADQDDVVVGKVERKVRSSRIGVIN